MKSNKTLVLTILIVLAVTLTSISAFAFVYAATSTTAVSPSATASGTNGWSGMMGDWSGMSSMIGGYSGSSSAVQTPTSVQNTVLPLVGFVALIGAATTGISGGAYYLTGYKMRIAQHTPKGTVENSPQNITTPYTSVSKTLTSEERKVLDVLVSHDGKYLQKYIRAETGLSRLKTHRIVSRLAERGIVTLEKSGNTNEVHLSSWLQNSRPLVQKHDERMKNTEISA